MFLVNLHTHSTYSDGTLSPIELLKEILNKKISYFSLTDHDIISGWYEIKGKISSYKIKYSYGVELTTRNHDYLHILGYNIPIENNAFLLKLEEFRNRRIERIKKIFYKLNAIGIKVDISELNINNFSTFGRPHIARLLKKKKYVKSVKEAFEKYIAEGKPAYEPPMGPDVREAIETIKNSGGVAILAHPGMLCENIDFRKLKDYGLDGIEAFYYSHSNSKIKEYIEISKKYSFLISAGTDFHGPGTDRDKMYGFEYKTEYFNWLDKFMGKL